MLFVPFSENQLRQRQKSKLQSHWLVLYSLHLMSVSDHYLTCPSHPQPMTAHSSPGLSSGTQQNGIGGFESFPFYTVIQLLSSHFQVVQFWLGKGFSDIKSPTGACNAIFLPKKLHSHFHLGEDSSALIKHTEILILLLHFVSAFHIPALNNRLAFQQAASMTLGLPEEQGGISTLVHHLF